MELSVAPDLTILLQILQFIIITFLISKFVVPPIKKTMDARDKKIEDMQLKAKESLLLMQRKKEEYEQRLEELNKEIADYRVLLTKEASLKAHNMVLDLEKLLQEELEIARKEIQKQTIQAKENLIADLDNLSSELAMKISSVN